MAGPGGGSQSRGPGAGTRAEARAEARAQGPGPVLRLGPRGLSQGPEPGPGRWSLEAGARAQGVEPPPKKGDFSIFCSGDLKVFVKIKDDLLY